MVLYSDHIRLGCPWPLFKIWPPISLKNMGGKPAIHPIKGWVHIRLGGPGRAHNTAYTYNQSYMHPPCNPKGIGLGGDLCFYGPAIHPRGHPRGYPGGLIKPPGYPLGWPLGCMAFWAYGQSRYNQPRRQPYHIRPTPKRFQLCCNGGYYAAERHSNLALLNFKGIND